MCKRQIYLIQAKFRTLPALIVILLPTTDHSKKLAHLSSTNSMDNCRGLTTHLQPFPRSVFGNIPAIRRGYSLLARLQARCASNTTKQE